MLNATSPAGGRKRTFAPTTQRVVSPVGIKAGDVLEDGTFTGYGSMFGVIDGAGDVVAPGAFAASLARKSPKMLWQHDATRIVGQWLEAREDERGLWLKGRIIPETGNGREALALLRAGVLDGLSIGFETTECMWGRREDYETKYGQPVMGATYGDTDQVRILQQIDLWEVSLVTFPCLEVARVETVKQQPPVVGPSPQTVREIARRGHLITRLAASIV